MKKIISLFKRDYEGTRRVYDEIVPGAEWVVEGEGVATEKYDGTCCMVRDGKLYKRYDRKLSKSAMKRKKKDRSFVPGMEHYKKPPEGWEPTEPEPNRHTGHWPGWAPVTDSPDDQWHREGFENSAVEDGKTYELVGPKIQRNPYELDRHFLYKHGDKILEAPRTLDGLKTFFADNTIEGLVWRHPDGGMVKIKRKDFGLPWPPPQKT